MSRRSLFRWKIAAVVWGLMSGAIRAADPSPVLAYDFPCFTEGPVFDAAGNLFVSETKTNQVIRITPAGERSVWTAQKGVNGHKVFPNGNHVLCVQSSVLLLDPAGRVLRAYSTESEGVPLRAPNDLTLDRAGGVYFTDPGGSRERPIGTVHYVDPAGVTHLVAGGLRVPNGLVLSPDGRFLYVAETASNRILRFSVLENGRLGPIQIFATLPPLADPRGGPDGITVDREGNVYVADLSLNAIQVLAPSGALMRTLPAGNYDASNLAFGGSELNELFITGSTGFRGDSPGRVYRIALHDIVGVSVFPSSHR
jgi:gluconolactonase